MPKEVPVLLTVPAMSFIMADGRGNPNEAGGEYQCAVEILYTLSYGIKMNKAQDGYVPYTVFPLEGLWHTEEDGADFSDKSRFCWTSMIRQPDFVSRETFERVREAVKKKKPHLPFDKVRFASFDEGLCVQCLHIGSYDDEPQTLRRLHDFMAAASLVGDCNPSRRHHEIYLSDPRRTAEARRKTVLRLPVRVLH